jgi:hypothetical protein
MFVYKKDEKIAADIVNNNFEYPRPDREHAYPNHKTYNKCKHNNIHSLRIFISENIKASIHIILLHLFIINKQSKQINKVNKVNKVNEYNNSIH